MKYWLVSAVVVLMFPLNGVAGETVSDNAVETRFLALEDELRATKAELAVLRSERAAPEVSAGEGLDGFFSGLEVGGHIAASYTYNFNNPEAGPVGSKSGFASQPLCQFNCQHNTFKLDAAKLAIGKPTNGPGTTGFQLDLLFGQNADILRFLSPTAGGAGAFGEDDFSLFVQQAYLAYDFNGIELKFGNFETLLGWELLDSHLNNQVTHGILFTWAIPLYHTGIMASGSLNESINWNLGVVNGFNNTIEQNDQKGALGLLSWESGGFFTSLSGYYGFDNPDGSSPLAAGGQPSSSDAQMILDYVASFQATDALAFWLNADYGMQEDGDPVSAGDAEWWGIAVGTRYDFNEKLYGSLRYEYFADDDNVRGIAGASDDFEASSFTGTLGYKLGENLMLRGELRYDEADDDGTPPNGSGDIFGSDDSPLFAEDDAVYGIVEVSYVFE